MKRAILITAMICLTALAGCAEVPDEVLQDMSGYRQESRVDYEESDGQTFTYIKVSELSSNVEAALKKDYKQFVISDKINFRQPEELHIMSFEKQNKTGDFNGIMGIFFDQETLLGLDVETRDDGAQVFYDEEKKIYAIVDADGFTAALTPDGFEQSYGEAGDVVKIYHADRLDDLSDVYPLNDGDCSVAQAVEFANKMLTEQFKPFFPQYDYEVETIIVRKPDDKCYFEMNAHCIYKGVPLDSYTRILKHSESVTEPGGMDYMDKAIYIRMIESDSICAFTTGGDHLIPIEISDIEECISLDSALDFCANEFADFKSVELSEIGLMYTILPIYGEKTELPDGSFEMKLLRYESRPVWEFIMDIPREQIPKADVPDGDMRKTIYIDAVTGEMNYIFEPSSRW